MRTPSLWAALLSWGMALATTVHAADLLQAWQATAQHHPDAATALATRQAGDARRLQADRLWNPTVGAAATAGVMGTQTSMQGAAFSTPGASPTAGVGFQTSVHQGPGSQWGVAARLPLYSPERSAQQRQLQLSADLADQQWTAAQQQLMQQTAERYFAVVQAQDGLRVVSHQKAAADRALAEARDRFALGDAPVTDTREAEARALGLHAQELAAQVDLQVAQQALASFTGWPADALPSLVPAPLQPSHSGAERPLEEWLASAEQHNPQIRQQSIALDVARQEAAKAATAASTTVDLVAKAGGEHLSGSGRWGQASNASRQFMVGVQLQVPLYTGGQRDARWQELLRLQDKAQSELDSARLSISQSTRATWLRLQAGAARTRALESAANASRLRLESTQLGRQVGDRTTLDLLLAQNDAAQAEWTLLQHRSAMALERLRLLALTGQLNDAALQMATAHSSEANP